MKKLSLNRETVRRLDATTLEQIQGGAVHLAPKTGGPPVTFINCPTRVVVVCLTNAGTCGTSNLPTDCFC